MVFTTDANYSVKIMSGGEKTCLLRWPTDAEWCARVAKQQTIRRIIGRGQTVSESPNARKATAELFEKIRVDVDGGSSFDEHEAERAISKLERCDVVGIERSADTYTVRFSVPRAEVSHTLRIPTQKDVQEYAAASIHRRDGRRETITTVSLEPGGRLYDKIFVRSEGYGGASVPIIHKDAAVVEVLTQMELDLEGDDDESGI